jgi:hypothetical protein
MLSRRLGQHALVVVLRVVALTSMRFVRLTHDLHGSQPRAAVIIGLQPAASAAHYRPRRPGLTVSVLLTFYMWPHTLMQNICRRVVLRQRLIYYKGRSTF